MTKPAPNSFFKRVKFYTDEMFPVLIYLPYIIALYVCLNFSTQALSSGRIVVDVYGVVGMVSAFFIMLLMRTFDDLKDFDLDKDIFPHRVSAQNLVFKKDIQTLSLFSFVVLIAVNVFFASATVLVFGIVLTYCVLTFKWFFAEKIHREKVFLTMATHQPIPYAINFYLIHTGLAAGGFYESFTINTFYLLLIFSLPVTAWEVARKIRSADMETNYETFSMIFGPKTAAAIPMVALLLSGTLSLYVGSLLALGTSFYIITGALLVYVLWIYLRFIINPINKNNVLKNAAMIFTTLLFFSTLTHILLVSEVSFNL